MKKWFKKILTKWGINFLTKKIDNMGKSWKTTLLGVGALLGVIAHVLIVLLDGDPATNFDIATVISDIVAALVGMGLIKAKDGDVTHSDNKTK